ncbi:hypothetical protein LTR28_002032, partial [Elasticomyces elasticus]
MPYYRSSLASGYSTSGYPSTTQYPDPVRRPTASQSQLANDEIESREILQPELSTICLTQGKKHDELDQLQDKLLADIKEAVDAGSVDEISVSKHLGALLQVIGSNVKRGSSENYVSSFILQQVFAHGSSAHPSRSAISGSTQEDAYELYGQLVDALAAESRGTKGLDELFQVKSRPELSCKATGCSHRHDLEEETA